MDSPRFPHEPVADPAQAGCDPERLRRAVELFEQQHAKGLFPGGQLVLRHDGKLVIDAAIGLARGYRPEEGEPGAEVTPETLFPVFSAGKPLVAVVIAMLEERGLLEVTAPVGEVFEQFAANGKAEITVLDVLTHRAGVLLPELVRAPERWADRDFIVDSLARARPTWPRGTLAYMPYEFGWILAEVVQRVTGRTLPEFVEEEIAGPAGLPRLRFGARPEELDRISRAYWLGTRKVFVAGTELSQTFEQQNNTRQVLTAFVPGAGVVCDAATLAGFYEILGRQGLTRGGARLLSPETIRRYTTGAALAFDRSNRVPLTVGRGFLLGGLGPSVFGRWDSRGVFGHAGAFCTLGFGDAKGTAVAIVTNGNRGPFDALRRFAPLSDALRAACR